MTSSKKVFSTPIPCILLGEFTILPKRDVDHRPVPHRWVLPGCIEMTTDQIRRFAETRRLYFKHVTKRKELF